MDLFPVVGLDARSVFTLDNVNGTVVGTMSGIELDTGFGVRVTGPVEKSIVLAGRYLLYFFFPSYVLSRFLVNGYRDQGSKLDHGKCPSLCGGKVCETSK